MAKRSPGQTVLLQAVRLQDNKEMGTLVERANLDDLEWFALILDLQLEETPHWVKDEGQLHKIQAWHRRVRTMVLEVLHLRRVSARKRERALRIARDIGLVILGGLITALFAWAFG
jgi:hypothetical protein